MLNIDTISQRAPSTKTYGFHMCYRKHKEDHKGMREPLFSGFSLGTFTVVEIILTHHYVL